jgi:cell pole-organizing protein PopZ
MSEAKGQHEPSMEEILASIRRIIAEDGDGGAQPAAAPEPPRPQQRPDEVLELTEVVDDEGSVMSLGAKQSAPEPPPPPPAPDPLERMERMEREPPRRDDDERLVSESTAAASVAALSQLMGAGRERLPQDLALGGVGRTLEDMVRELLRPLLKSWLDEHLTPLVERLVREEISRLVREVQGR